MDPLSSVLSLLNARGMLVGRLEAGGEWCIQSPHYESLRFGALLQGMCWIEVEGNNDAICLKAGDCYLLTDGRPYRIASNLGTTSVPMERALEGMAEGVIRLGEVVDQVLLGGRFNLDPLNASFLLHGMPSVIRVATGSGAPHHLSWLLDSIVTEQQKQDIGCTSIIEHLMDVMLVQMVRAYLASEHPQAVNGWLAALADAKIGAALEFVHREPSKRLSLGELASSAGMSRSAFSLRFKTLVGCSPLLYVLRWRMRLAGQALRAGNASVSSIGIEFGYDSDSAFSAAFKRVMGRSPQAYRNQSAPFAPVEKRYKSDSKQNKPRSP